MQLLLYKDYRRTQLAVVHIGTVQSNGAVWARIATFTAPWEAIVPQHSNGCGAHMCGQG